ncbi:MAG TPA: ATP phosphoribosyltransferase, partial [Pseudomonadales bacterium]|nr:ATP phosphoribosyltransferase [Pseudomonadales bacterium]
NDVEFFYLRPKDIATYVGKGQLDAGITGRDLLLDSAADAEEILALGFGRSTFRLAAPAGALASAADVAGRRVATSYEGLTRQWLQRSGIDAEVVRLDGAVENSISLGVADAIADVVSTGTTLRRAGLEPVGEAIQESEAILIRRAGAEPSAPVEQLQRRLQGVLIARQYVLMDYDVRVETVDRACEITPGLEAPTISPLHKDGWVAVRAMVERLNSHRVMDELYELGARGILVTDIHACRL